MPIGRLDANAMELIAILKYVLLFGTAPIWMPFTKAVWTEFLDSLRMDGGLWGPTPTPIQQEEIRRQIEREMPRQVHEPKSSYRQSSSVSAAKQRRRQPSVTRGGPAAGPQSGGSGGTFRRR